jgi:CRP/FNR family cyclic AMP-dependent transcriptional regulator
MEKSGRRKAMNIEQMIDRIPLFAGLSDSGRRMLAESARRKVFPKNTVVMSEGDRTDSLYIICEGKVKVTIIDEHGKEIILSILEPGDYFGEMTALVDGESRSASVVTRTPCEMLMLAKEDFRRIISANPDIVFSLLHVSMERLRKANRKIESLALMDVYGRVARLFTELARPEADGLLHIREKLTHQEIANMVGSSREMISRVMKELISGGYITCEHKQITINGKLPYAW